MRHTYNIRVEAKHRLSSNASRSERTNAIQSFLKVFRRAYDDAGILHEYKEHEFFIRKTDKKRRKKMIKLRGALEGANTPENRDREQQYGSR